MSVFYPLDLPYNPLKVDIFQSGLPANRKKRLDKLLGRPGSYSMSYSPEDILSDELVVAFNKLDIKPYCVAFFMLEGASLKGKNRYRSIDHAYIHTDISVNNTQTGYDDVPFSINWQISPGIETWHWWNTGTVNPMIPSIDTDDRSIYNHLQARHYGFPRPEYNKIESVTVQGPTLVRTNVPHSITYEVDHTWYEDLYSKGQQPTRVSIGVRFNHREIKTWEEGVKIFSPIFRNP